MLDSVLLFIISIGIGIISSMLGIGGGAFIIMTLIFLYNTDYITSVSVSLTSMIALTIAGSTIYYRKGLVDIKLGVFFQVITILGAYIGALLTDVIPSYILKILFGIFLIIMGYFMIKDIKFSSSNIYIPDKILNGSFILKSGEKITYRVPLFLSSITIFSAGLLAGLLGIGGGLLVVPLLTLVCGFPIHIAIANSTFIMMATALSGSLAHMYLGHINLYLVSIVSIGYFIGGLIGPNITLSVDKKILKYLLEPIIIYASIRMLYEGLIIFI